MEIAALCRAMIAYFQGDTRRIQHFLKVHALAKCIGEREGLSAKALHTLEAAALTHDIAIRDCEREFGHCTGKMQEEFGPAKAVGLLLPREEARETAERVGVLVACHHTYTEDADPVYRALIEADFLVNACEDTLSADAVRKGDARIFRTETGKALLRDFFPAAFSESPEDSPRAAQE